MNSFVHAWRLLFYLFEKYERNATSCVQTGDLSSVHSSRKKMPMEGAWREFLEFFFLYIYPWKYTALHIYSLKIIICIYALDAIFMCYRVYILNVKWLSFVLMYSKKKKKTFNLQRVILQIFFNSINAKG